ncbi:TOBE domain-containing protein [Mangrovicoccus ximenensis]|uniref:TOBE domain-containing protein n=1 Tax=Mangrovicoccus ximenensis TaxID=1911570 RepID=UPI001374F421|nr:TOBE domain-containing protein [Mangrovicoccus ximenensis]
MTGDGSHLRLSDGTPVARHPHRGAAILGIRPEQIRPAADGLPAAVTYREDLGAHAVLTLRLSDGTGLRMATDLGSRAALPADLRIAPAADALHLFDISTGRALAARPAPATMKAEHDHLPS